jgi:hypothetical protein
MKGRPGYSEDTLRKASWGRCTGTLLEAVWRAQHRAETNGSSNREVLELRLRLGKCGNHNVAGARAGNSTSVRLRASRSCGVERIMNFPYIKTHEREEEFVMQQGQLALR